MLYMKEMRPVVQAECTLKESAAINQILGRRVIISIYLSHRKRMSLDMNKTETNIQVFLVYVSGSTKIQISFYFISYYYFSEQSLHFCKVLYFISNKLLRRIKKHFAEIVYNNYIFKYSYTLYLSSHLFISILSILSILSIYSGTG